MEVTSLAARYCGIVEQSADYSKREFIIELLSMFPRIYIDFSDPELELGENDEYFST